MISQVPQTFIFNIYFLGFYNENYEQFISLCLGLPNKCFHSITVFLPFSMPFRGLSLMSLSVSHRQRERSTSWLPLLYASYQDDLYFSTDRVWMHIDW